MIKKFNLQNFSWRACALWGKKFIKVFLSSLKNEYIPMPFASVFVGIVVGLVVGLFNFVGRLLVNGSTEVTVGLRTTKNPFPKHSRFKKIPF